MNLQQLRYIRETVRQGLNLTAAAEALHTSQPGVSRQIRELEAELGFEVFERRGKRFTGLTVPGRKAVAVIERLLRETDNLRRVGDEHRTEGTGHLTIATTHTQARYSLPLAVAAFKREWPGVRLSFTQGSPTEIARLVIDGAADLGIATEALDHYPELHALPAFRWSHCVIVPEGHPLAAVQRLALEDIARYPVVTYTPEFAGRSHIDAAFAARGLTFDVVLAAIDSDVIKTYVELGLGIGIIARMAYDLRRDSGLVQLDAQHLFAPNMTRVAVRAGTYLRAFDYAFIERFSPNLTRATVERALAGTAESYEL